MIEIGGGLGNKMEDWVEKQHQMGKRERTRFCTMRNLQERANARAWVLHRNSDPVVIAQTLKVDSASKHKFKSETRDKEGIESKRERGHHTKRFKALDDWDIIKQENEFALALMGLLLTDTAKPNANAKGSTTTGGGAGEAK